MTRLVQRLSVSFEYPVYVTSDLFSTVNDDLVEAITAREPERRHRVITVVDSEVAVAWPRLFESILRYAERHAERLELVAPPLVLGGGEACKSDPKLIASLHARFRELQLDRRAAVVIVGGGAILDAVGYAAATCQRGLRVVRVPTTVLGQADSGVSLRTGVNVFGSKDFAGVHAPPFAVLNDPTFLRTLSRRDRTSGMAQAVKIALVRDARFLAWLDERSPVLAAGDLDALAYLCWRSAELHLDQLRSGGDPFEQGAARPLELGHWSAYKLEAMTEHRLRHGEALAIGMALDALYAERIGLLSLADARAVTRVLTRLGFRLWDDALTSVTPDRRPAVLVGLDERRAHRGGSLDVLLLRGLGATHEVHEIDEDAMLEALRELHRQDGV